MSGEIKRIVEAHNFDPDNLIPILQDIQETEGFLSKEAISAVADLLKISESRIFGVATFYAQFRFQKPGKHRLKVCQGTACHVRGGRNILNFVSKRLNVCDGETTEDELFTLEEVACLGCCALAPVIMVDDKVFGRQSSAKVEKVINKYQTAEANSKEGGAGDE